MDSVIVIIGAGIQGLSSAYNIAKGNKNAKIMVVESCPHEGKGSSGRSGSMLMKSRENKAKIELSLFSFQRLENFGYEFGEILKYKRLGFLSLVTKSMESRYLREHNLRLEMGVPSILINNKDLSAYCKGLNISDIEFGILGPDDCEIVPAQILNAFKKGAVARNVEIAFNERAIDIHTDGKRVIGVRTEKRLIECTIVVNAGGAEAKLIASWVGLDLQIENKRRSLFYVKTNSEDFSTGPMVEDAELEWYYRPMGGNQVLIGMGLEPFENPTDGPNLGFLPEIIKATKFRAKNLYPFEVFGGVSGIRSLTLDKLPIIGPIKKIEGYYNNCGWGGEGIMHSPAGGVIIADWINNTTIYPYEKNCFLLDRFLI
jgi:sarcosine oxidase, subunit beta